MLQIVASLIDATRGIIYDRHMFIVQAIDHRDHSLLIETAKGCIFSHVRPFYECAVSDLDP